MKLWLDNLPVAVVPAVVAGAVEEVLADVVVGDVEDEDELEEDFRSTFCDRDFASRGARTTHQEACYRC